MPAPRSRRRSVRPTGVESSLPTGGASKEFLEALFARHNIDGEQTSSKAAVEKELRQTLGSPQNEQMVEAVSCAVISHVEACVGQHAAVPEGAKRHFDERQHPLTEGAEKLNASLSEVQRWLWTILDALKLEPECLIISLVLLERALAKSELQLTPFTWRPCVLCSLVIASKARAGRLDGAVGPPQLPGPAHSLPPLPELPLTRRRGTTRPSSTSTSPSGCPGMICRTSTRSRPGSSVSSTTAPPSPCRSTPSAPSRPRFPASPPRLVAGFGLSLAPGRRSPRRYFFALQDVLTGMNGTGATRRSTWSPGESGQ